MGNGKKSLEKVEAARKQDAHRNNAVRHAPCHILAGRCHYNSNLFAHSANDVADNQSCEIDNKDGLDSRTRYQQSSKKLT
jgi:hypothetical protein